MPIFSSKTKCGICEQVIGNAERVAFPHFTSSESRFYIFSDAIIHKRCFDEHPLRNELREFIKKYIDPSDKQWGWFYHAIDEYYADDNLGTHYVGGI